MEKFTSKQKRNIILLVIVIFLMERINHKMNEIQFVSYLPDLNLRLTGQVIATPICTQYRNFCIVKLKVIKSNILKYDPWKKNDKYYYCMIKNDYAEIYQFGLYDALIGDTIDIDTRAKKIYYYQNERRMSEDLRLSDDPNFYDYVEEYHLKNGIK